MHSSDAVSDPAFHRPRATQSDLPDLIDLTRPT